MQTIDPRIVDQFNARAPFKLEDATVLVLARIGSHSHNTHIPKEGDGIDDTDFMGVVIPPESYVFGLKNWDNLSFQFEELDCVFYSFRKFVNLLIKSNPNVLGLLWLREEDYIAQSKEWEWMLACRTDFSSLEAYHSFVGYAKGQMQKMTHFDLKTQQEYELCLQILAAIGTTKEDVLNNTPTPCPTINQSRIIDDLTKPGSEYSRLIEELGWPQFGGSPHVYNVATAHIPKAIESIKRIQARHFQSYMGEKRKKLVMKYGYDCKNGSHLIRLMVMCVNYLQTGVLQVFRTYDADYIKAIKRGEYSLDEIKSEAEALFLEAKDAKEKSPLPEKPNMDVIDLLVQDIHLSAYGLEHV
jgi:hypothetical protein